MIKAARQGRTKMCQLLLEHGADVNKASSVSNLQWWPGCPSTVRVLILGLVAGLPTLSVALD